MRSMTERSLVKIFITLWLSFLLHGCNNSNNMGSSTQNNTNSFKEASTNASTKSGSYAYVVDTASSRIYMFSTANGALTPLSPSYFQLESNSHPIHITISPNKQFAYLPNSGTGSISVLSIDQQSGQLMTIATTNMPASEMYPVRLVFTSAGKYAYVTSTACSSQDDLCSNYVPQISMYSVDTGTGLLTLLSPGSIKLPTSANINVAVDTDSTHLYVGNVYMSTNSQTKQFYPIYIYNINGNGQLTDSGVTAASTGATTAMEFSHGNLYTASYADGSQSYFGMLSVYQKGRNGELTTPNAYHSGGTWNPVYAKPLAITQNKSFVYVADAVEDNLYMFKADPITGTLSALSTPIQSITMPQALAIDSSDQFLYILSNNPKNPGSWYTSFRIESIGLLASAESGIIGNGAVNASDFALVNPIVESIIIVEPANRRLIGENEAIKEKMTYYTFVTMAAYVQSKLGGSWTQIQMTCTPDSTDDTETCTPPSTGYGENVVLRIVTTVADSLNNMIPITSYFTTAADNNNAFALVRPSPNNQSNAQLNKAIVIASVNGTKFDEDNIKNNPSAIKIEQVLSDGSQLPLSNGFFWKIVDKGNLLQITPNGDWTSNAIVNITITNLPMDDDSLASGSVSFKTMTVSKFTRIFPAASDNVTSSNCLKHIDFSVPNTITGPITLNKNFFVTQQLSGETGTQPVDGTIQKFGDFFRFRPTYACFNANTIITTTENNIPTAAGTQSGSQTITVGPVSLTPTIVDADATQQEFIIDSYYPIVESAADAVTVDISQLRGGSVVPYPSTTTVTFDPLDEKVTVTPKTNLPPGLYKFVVRILTSCCGYMTSTITVTVNRNQCLRLMYIATNNGQGFDGNIAQYAPATELATWKSGAAAICNGLAAVNERPNDNDCYVNGKHVVRIYKAMMASNTGNTTQQQFAFPFNMLWYTGLYAPMRQKTQYYNIDRVLIGTTDENGVFPNSTELTNPIDPVGGDLPILTGMLSGVEDGNNVDWWPSFDNCNAWRDGSDNYSATVGHAFSTDPQSVIYSGNIKCSERAAITCAQVLP